MTTINGDIKVLGKASHVATATPGYSTLWYNNSDPLNPRWMAQLEGSTQKVFAFLDDLNHLSQVISITAMPSNDMSLIVAAGQQLLIKNSSSVPFSGFDPAIPRLWVGQHDSLTDTTGLYGVQLPTILTSNSINGWNAVSIENTNTGNAAGAGLMLIDSLSNGIVVGWQGTSNTTSTIPFSAPGSAHLLVKGGTNGLNIGLSAAGQQIRFYTNLTTRLLITDSGFTMSNPLSMSGYRITNLADGTASGDAATFGQVSTMLSGHTSRTDNPHNTTWTQVVNNPVPSSLGDLSIRSAADLSSGELDDARLSSNIVMYSRDVGVANGVCPLDAGTKIPISYLPSAVLTYKGTWDAATNTPTLVDLVAASKTIQFITYTAVALGIAGNLIEIIYVDDVLAGSEYVTGVSPIWTVHIQASTSTNTQIKTAWDAGSGVADATAVIVSGHGSDTPVVDDQFLINGTDGNGTSGDLWISTSAGHVTFNNGVTYFDFESGDWVLYNGTTWEQTHVGNNVDSVNGYTGTVILTKSDIGLSAVPNINATNASNISSGTLADAQLSANVTIHGNTFNGINQLVQLNNFGQLPAIDGSLLTGISQFPASSDLSMNNWSLTDINTLKWKTDNTTDLGSSDSGVTLLRPRNVYIGGNIYMTAPASYGIYNALDMRGGAGNGAFANGRIHISEWCSSTLAGGVQEGAPGIFMSGLYSATTHWAQICYIPNTDDIEFAYSSGVKFAWNLDGSFRLGGNIRFPGETGTLGTSTERPNIVYAKTSLNVGVRLSEVGTIYLGYGGSSIAGDSTAGLLTVNGAFFGPVNFKSAQDAALNAELITAVADRDMSGPNNWSGTNWAVGSGVYTHTAGANIATLAGYGATSGMLYQIVMSIETTTAGSLLVSFGGTSNNNLGKTVESATTYTMMLQASTTAGLVVTPDANWTGSIDNISVKSVIGRLPTLSIQTSSGILGLETRVVNNASFGFGVSALGASTTGTGNLALGYWALRYVSTGSSNIGIGYHALRDNTTGSNNIAIASTALSSNLTGSGNIGIGGNTLSALVGGLYNTAIGIASMMYKVSGISNTTIGHNSLILNTTGSYNTAIGDSALHFNLIGGGNVALGYDAGAYETGSNAFYVDNQDRLNTAGDKAGALLYGTFNAIPSNQTLRTNSIFSVLNQASMPAVTAGYLTLSGSGGASGRTFYIDLSSAPTDTYVLTYSSGTGMWAPAAASSGEPLFMAWKAAGNVIAGSLAGGSITTAMGVIALGTMALSSLTTSSFNTAVGHWALQPNSPSGDGHNSAFGSATLQSNITGKYNTGIGAAALAYNITGSSNVALGYAAGRNDTGSNSFYVNNINQVTMAGDKAYSLLYGTFSGTAASLVGQQLTINAGTINLNGKAVFLGGLSGLIFQFDLMVETPVVKTYVFSEKVKFAGTIDNLTHYAASIGGSGSFTISVQINGANVTGLTGLSVTASQTTAGATATNTFVVGDRITLVVTAITTPAPTDFSGTLQYTRTS